MQSEGTEREVSLAQLVEQLTLNQWVEGSSPSGDTKKDIRIRMSLSYTEKSCHIKLEKNVLLLRF